MTATKVVRGLIVTAALCLSTTSVRAQGYRLFIMGADSPLTDKRTFREGPNGSSTIPYGSRYAGGGKGIAGVEVPFYKIFGIEGSYGFGPNNLEITNFNYNPATVLAYGVRNNRFSGDIVGHVPGVWRGIRAYGVVGVEYDLFSPTSSAKTLAKTEGFASRPAPHWRPKARRALTPVPGSITKWHRRSTCGSTRAITRSAPPPTVCPRRLPRPPPPTFRSVGRRMTSNTL